MPDERDILPFDSTAPRPLSGLAITSFILGVISIPLDIALFAGSVIGLFAVIVGAIAIVRINRSNRWAGKGLAIAGIILGVASWLVAIGCGVASGMFR